MSTVTINPHDPMNLTGPTRQISGVARLGAVTPDTKYGEFARMLYVGVTGDVSLICWDGSTVVLKAMQAGVWHPVCSIGVNATGTTATNLVWGS